MRLAYLLNSYPMTSTTFIRREIAAIERAGVPVKRFAVRRWSGKLVDPRDLEESGRVEYLLSGNHVGLVAVLIGHALCHPRSFLSGLAIIHGMARLAGGGLIRHMAYLAQAILLARRCRLLGISHVHAHFSTNAAAVAMLSRRLGGPPYSFTVHGPEELERLEASSFVEKAEHATRVFAISAYCRARLSAALPPMAQGKLVIVPCGIDLGDYPAPPPPPSATPLLVSVGRLCPQKGQAEIPAAVQALGDRHPNASVVIVGDGESRDAIERAITASATADRIRLLGWRDNDDVAALLAEARALLLPSHAEGLPIVIMEAFALGRPVIATRIAGIPELVDESCGWLVEPGDLQALVGAMDAALASDVADLVQMGCEARARVVASHDIDAIARRLLAELAQANE